MQVAFQTDSKSISYAVLADLQPINGAFHCNSQFFRSFHNASGVVMKVTKTMAKYKALKLMEEVGIADTRKRYNQYDVYR